jgi:hypothetical protein
VIWWVLAAAAAAVVLWMIFGEWVLDRVDAWLGVG